MRRTVLLWTLCFLAVFATAAMAGGTRVWELSSQAHFDKGTLEGVVSFTPGGIRLGPQLTKLQVEEVGVWRTYLSPGGDLYVGTAKNASVYRLEGGKLKRILKTKELAVTDLIMDGRGNLYAATIPNGKIFRIPPTGKQAIFKLPDPFPWRLALDRDDNIYVASGPKGKVYHMENGGGWVKEVFAADGEKNIISLAPLPGGGFLCGSAEHGILYRVATAGTVTVVHNFPEKEIREIAIHPGGIYVATNISQKSFKQEAFVSEMASVLQSEAAGRTTPGAKRRFKKLMNGKVYHIDGQDRVDLVMTVGRNYILSLAVNKDGSVLAGTGVGGRVYRADRRGNHFTWIDLKEEQVITMTARAGELLCLGTGHPGKLFLVEKSPGDKGAYLSEVLDTGFPSVFGRFFWDGRGSVTVQTRTGNTVKPDKTWADWSRPLSRSLSRTESPKGRFFQFRINFEDDPDAVVTQTRVYFTRANQRPSVQTVTVGTAPAKQVYPLGGEAIVTKLSIKIKAVDPDADKLVYRVSYRETGKDRWIPLADGKPLVKADLSWTVTDMPDGTYEIKVEASDEASNPPGEALKAVKVSPPFLIDLRKPRVENLSVDVGRKTVLRGRAVDTASQITRVEVSVDDGPWQFVYPEDRVFDSRSEDFNAVLTGLTPGSHRATVRVKDRAGNTAVAEIEFNTK